MQRLTPSQLITLRDSRGNSRSFDMMSIFSLRPPELLRVFDNPRHYFRFCHIEESCYDEEEMKRCLRRDLRVCRWIDCLGRRVYIREKALPEVKEHVIQNLDDLNTSQYWASQSMARRHFHIQMNQILIVLVLLAFILYTVILMQLIIMY